MASEISSTAESVDDEPMQMSGKKRGDDEMDITPMIDITFLLLIFFVVASKMDPTQTAQTPRAEAGLAVSAKDSAVIFVERGSGDKAILKRSDESTFSDDEDAQVTEILDYVQQRLDDGKQQVMILGNWDVSVGEIGRLRRIVGDHFEDLGVTYIAVKEE